jgi:hypothetical protein
MGISNLKLQIVNCEVKSKLSAVSNQFSVCPFADRLLGFRI